ncbi:MATE family efflux transporter [Anaerosporobacter faecicola]|uniref:MATE family efflux transporter n=1 Tax=Anaerosporobacter faecicola TaxID=2718714 RepID=UPI00143BE93C|nr:MATE family efflux transporter [Anaerosporobacter faecicola]
MDTKHDFTQGNILKKLVTFMVPVFGALILQAMYGAVDLMIVGWFGTTAGISAVSTGSNIVNLVVFTVTGLSMGITVLISRYIGEGKTERIGKVLGGVICFFLILSVVLTIVMIFAAPSLAVLMQAPEEAVELTTLYVRICGGGIIFVIAYNVISSIFRGLGNSKLPLIFVAIACVVNIVGDLLFVAVFHMNVAGAALATILAQAVSVVLSIVIIRKQGLPFPFKKEDIGFSPEVWKFLKLGLPIALQEMLTNMSFLVLCALINRLGLEASSGYGVAQKIVTFVMLVPSSLMQSMSSVVGQNVGAGKEKRAKAAMVSGMCVGAGVGILIAVFVFFCGDVLSLAFTKEAPVIARSWEYLKGFAPEAVLTSFLFSYIGYFNGHGMTLFVMAQGLAQTFLVRLPMSYIMSIQPDANLTSIGLAAPTATVFGIAICSTSFIIYQKKLKKRVIS